ncbi:dihydrofolate reductase [Kitasatospora sp. NPDC048538]|uniref:dihydrofolate reductase n=1 Tax=unclassified Kitasatospora TaxID=2633591 RepID=UPI0033E57963
MRIGLIWAQARGGVIGADNTMPWHLPEDLEHFKRTTLGHPVVMGRRTWESIPPRFRPLPGRRNIVVTRNPQWAADGAERAGSLAEALRLAAAAADPGTPAETWIIGGGQLYRTAIDHATTLSVTEIDLAVDGDTHAPPVGSAWTVTRDDGWQTSTTGLRYRIRTHTRRA